MTKDLPVWRSMLFVPVTQRRFVEGAARRGADAIILDLEDSVAASEKERARTLLPEADGLLMPKQMCVFAARAAGIMPLGFVGTVAEFHDLDGFRETVRRSRRLGFMGASVIHPSQIAILNEEFRPGAGEIDHAR